MRVLVIGGTRFVGYFLTWRLLARGDEVTLFNRQTLPDPFGGRVERIRGDRRDPGFSRLLEGRRFDATVDFAAFEPGEVKGVVAALGERAGHYVLISSGQVYLVRQGAKSPASETDYEGPLQQAPAFPSDLSQWEYGMKKRACEDALVEEGRGGFVSTRLRLPMVNGERDYHRRIEAYLWRILDGGPLILPDGGKERARHVYALDVAAAIASLLGDGRTFGRAYNLSQEETPTVFELVGLLIDRLGAQDNRVAIPRARLGGLPAQELSPFSQRWMSCLDASAARRELGFCHRPLGEYLSSIVASFLAHPPPSPPEGYRHRPEEWALVKGLRA